LNAVALSLKLTRAARGAGRALLATVLTAILLLGVLRAGDRYFYCDFMGVVTKAPCCDGAHDDADGKRLEVRADDCCKSFRLGTLPAAAIPAEAPQAPPAVVAVVQPVPVQLLLLPPNPRVLRGAQTGPPASFSANDRSRLMVFLI
jgi:hypothetical protein